MPVVEPVVTEEKLRQLLDEGSESAQLDFKQQLELSVQRDKVELAKDVGAMQVEGGYFVVGATDTGQPSGAMTTAVAARFDEASVRNIVKKWIPEPFDIRIGRHVLSTTATSFSSTSPQIPTACACSALTGSTLTPAASRPRCSVPATSTHATAPRTNEWHSTTSPESCASLADVEKDKWGREIIETLQPQLALGPQAQQLARGPITNYALQLPLDTFEATTVEVLRAGDDMALRRVLNDAAAAASEELHRAGTMSEDLEPLLDRVAAVVAIGLAYVRRTEFDLAVAALARIYELGFDRSGYRAHCPHRDW